MGWLDKIFGKQQQGEAPRASPPSQPAMTQQFEEDEDDDAASVTKRRRELVQIVLRDTMRRHGIPSDWIECKILAVVSTTRGTGMHVLLVVRHGDDRLATYVHAFQESFTAELLKYEQKARDWLFSVSWQFEGKPQPGRSAMPDPASWNPDGTPKAPQASQPAPLEMPSPGEEQDSQLEEDLQALLKIRQAAFKAPQGAGEPQQPDFEPTRPGEEEAPKGR